MRRLRSFIQRNGLIVPLVILLMVMAAGLTYLVSTLAVLPTRQTVSTTPFRFTQVPPLPGTPIQPFGQIDPAIADYLDKGQPSYGVIPLDALGANIQPVGAYLPKSGNMQYGIPQPTLQPTPLPYPTSPPLPNPPIPNQILPTISAFNPDGTPRLLPYAGASCAPSGLPVDGILTQRFHAGHSGVDLGVPLGTPVQATMSGQVTFADWSEVGYGYLVILQNGPYITYYAHNTSFNVTVGQFVGKGSIVSWSGSTGNSTGPHVHYETRINDVPVDPLTFESRGYPSC